jgi:hypothetical protein
MSMAEKIGSAVVVWVTTSFVLGIALGWALSRRADSSWGSAVWTVERSYLTIDKSEWGPGAWQGEPDTGQWTDEAAGLPCLAKRQPHGTKRGTLEPR